MLSKILENLEQANSGLKKAIKSNNHDSIRNELNTINKLAEEIDYVDLKKVTTTEKEKLKLIMRDFSISSTAIQQLKKLHERHLKKLRGNDLVYGPNS